MDEGICVIFTDGSCWPNPGPGSWAYRYMDAHGNTHDDSGYCENTTNNRMELQAVIEGIRYATIQPLKKRNKGIIVYTDSALIVGWLSQNWRVKANHDLINEATEIMRGNRVRFQKVKGHTGNFNNEFVDRLAAITRENKGI